MRGAGFTDLARCRWPPNLGANYFVGRAHIKGTGILETGFPEIGGTRTRALH